MVRYLQFQWANPLSLTAPKSLDLAKEDTQGHLTNSVSRKRVEFIDITRGLLLLFMVHVHALFLAGVPEFNASRSLLWLPQGLAHSSFVILSGFAIGHLFFQSSRNLRQSQQKLLRRAKEIFLVMFVSNVLLLGIKHLVQGNLALLGTLDWWIGLFTFQTPYSLSAILIPTALLCLLAPLILHAHAKQYTRFILPIMIGTSVLIAWAQRSAMEIPDLPLILDVLLINGAGGIKILPMLGYGLVGLALGIVWHQHQSIPLLTTSLVSILCIANFSLFPENPAPALSITKLAILAPTKFCLILAAGILIASWMTQTPIGKYLALIGKYSLFCFLVHRIILQALQIPLELIFNLTPDGLFVFLLVGTLTILGTLCFFRTQNAQFTNVFKKVYL